MGAKFNRVTGISEGGCCAPVPKVVGGGGLACVRRGGSAPLLKILWGRVPPCPPSHPMPMKNAIPAVSSSVVRSICNEVAMGQSLTG